MISLTGGRLDKGISGFLHPVLFTEIASQAVRKRAFPGKRTGNGKTVIQVAVRIADLAEIGFDPLLIGQARIDLDAADVHQFFRIRRLHVASQPPHPTSWHSGYRPHAGCQLR